MRCVFIWERVISKIRKVGSKKEILQIYCRQLRLDSCAINIYTASVRLNNGDSDASQWCYNLFYFI